MTTLQSLNINIEVLNELINAQSEGRTPKTDIIKNYIGFGAIKEISYDITNDDHWNPSNKKIRSLLVDLYEKLSNHYGPSVADRTFESMRSSTLTAFYTPELIVNPIVDFFDKLAIKENKVLNVLDPSSGTGAFVAPLLNLKSINSVTSIEKDLLTSTIQKHIYSDTKTKFHAGPFEKIINTTNYENSTFIRRC